MGRVGRPAARRRGLPLHERVHAVRERPRRRPVPADPRRDLDQRHPRALRRAREVDREAPRGRRARAAEDRDVRRPRWCQRSLRVVEGAGVRTRLAARRARARRRDARRRDRHPDRRGLSSAAHFASRRGRVRTRDPTSSAHQANSGARNARTPLTRG
ncbi:hypothetical protein CURTO8I2_250121 [Curtobacterium sp. 8I-2]|nr:hypothetical protein CURTO8I2_250121 [Curtobacterium sp. 8I-2]